MAVKKGLPVEMEELLKQLVMNGDIRMAGIVLFAYCRRMYQVDEGTAARWMVAYFEREFPRQLQRYRNRIAKS